MPSLDSSSLTFLSLKLIIPSTKKTKGKKNRPAKYDGSSTECLNLSKFMPPRVNTPAARKKNSAGSLYYFSWFALV